jgi:hypothetical protein
MPGNKRREACHRNSCYSGLANGVLQVRMHMIRTAALILLAIGALGVAGRPGRAMAAAPSDPSATTIDSAAFTRDPSTLRNRSSGPNPLLNALAISDAYPFDCPLHLDPPLPTTPASS